MLNQFKLNKKLPDSPGVYFFLNRQKKILYIGKATSLRNRVRSYFASDLTDKRSPLIAKMVAEASAVDFKKTESVLEALILETDLIKKFKPVYNTKEKDDRSFNCVAITKEDFPRVLIIRESDLKLKAESWKLAAIYGPFPNAKELKSALRIIRKIFPYRDGKCEPNQGKPCFNYQIGLCPGVCIGIISKQQYSETISHLKLFFSGKKTILIKKLIRLMKVAVKDKKFELAGKYKSEIFALQHVNDVALINDNHKLEQESNLRIEAYDVAHLSGKEATGVMVVFRNGKVDNSAHRVFHLRASKPGDDLAGLKEILSRRLRHKEWPKPDFIVVDGGQIHKKTAEEILRQTGENMPVVTVTKDDNHKPKSLSGPISLINKYKKEIVLLNNEAHRFALKSSRRRRKIML